jgi:prepilin-type N-terminal cleavage/methylation domain-containing protein
MNLLFNIQPSLRSTKAMVMRQIANNNRCKGFTLIELVVVIAMVGVLTVGVGVLLANGQRNWGTLTARVYGEPAVGNFAAHKAFDAVCRKASLRKHVLSEPGDSLELYYWNDASTASTPENYARFYQDGDDVFVEYGITQSGTWQPDTNTDPTIIQIAHDVDSLKFTLEGTSIQMYLNYSGENMMPMICSSVRHNE